jgi:hypothetical protein
MVGGPHNLHGLAIQLPGSAPTFLSGINDTYTHHFIFQTSIQATMAAIFLFALFLASSISAVHCATCPPAGFDSMAGFNLVKYIQGEWYIQEQVSTTVLLLCETAAAVRCVHAEAFV